MKKYCLFVAFILFIGLAQAQQFEGDWYGAAQVNGMQLRLVFHLQKKDNTFSGTMDSPDQKANGIPLTAVDVHNDSITIQITQARFTYNAILKDDKLIGYVKQAGMKLALNMSRQAIEAKPINRPQTPKPPFDYLEEEVSFTNSKAKVTLSGTLTLPKQGSNFPAVVLITGSGPQNRNEEILKHQPFAVIADYLTKLGIAVLRYDDRGVGKSSGNFSTASTFDFADDAESAFQYLLERKEIDKQKIGFIGHSEGGIIAPIIAARNKKVSFIVLLAGTSVDGAEILIEQNQLIGKGMGQSQAYLQFLKNMQQQLFTAVKTETNDAVLQQNLKQILETAYSTHQEYIPASSNLKEVVQKSVQEYGQYWMTNFIRYNPKSSLLKVKCSMLALLADKDLQVPASLNAPVFEQVITSTKNKHAKVHIFSGLNHLFQTCTTGLTTEYGVIEQTISPEVLDYLAGWLIAENIIIKK